MNLWRKRTPPAAPQEEPVHVVAERLLHAELSGQPQVYFHALHEERCRPDWPAKAAAEMRSVMAQNLDKLRADPRLDDAMESLDAIAERPASAFNYSAGLSLPKPQPVENVEDALNLILFSRQSRAAFARMSQSIGQEMDDIVQRHVPGHPSVVGGSMAEMENVETIAADYVGRFLRGLQCVARPRTATPDQEYRAAWANVLKFAPVWNSLIDAVGFQIMQIGAAALRYARKAGEERGYPASEEIEKTIAKFRRGSGGIPYYLLGSVVQELLKDHLPGDERLKAYASQIRWQESHNDFFRGMSEASGSLLSRMRREPDRFLG